MSNLWGPGADSSLLWLHNQPMGNRRSPWLLTGISTPQRVQLWTQGAEGRSVLRAGRPAQLHELLNLRAQREVGGAGADAPQLSTAPCGSRDRN